MNVIPILHRNISIEHVCNIIELLPLYWQYHIFNVIQILHVNGHLSINLILHHYFISTDKSMAFPKYKLTQVSTNLEHISPSFLFCRSGQPMTRVRDLAREHIFNGTETKFLLFLFCFLIFILF